MLLQLVDQILLSVQGSSVTELAYRTHGYRIQLTRGIASARAADVAVPVAAAEPALAATSASPPVGHTVCAAMFGTFYRAATPGQDPLVEVGQSVQVGQQLGVLEAMKMLNAVEADCAGRVRAIHVQNGAMVEAGAPLFTLEGGPDGAL